MDCFGLLWIALDCFGMPLNALDCFRLLWITLDCYGLFYIALDCSGLLCMPLACSEFRWIDLNYCELLLITIDFRNNSGLLQRIFVDFCGLLWSLDCYSLLLWIAVEYCELLATLDFTFFMLVFITSCSLLCCDPIVLPSSWSAMRTFDCSFRQQYSSSATTLPIFTFFARTFIAYSTK